MGRKVRREAIRLRLDSDDPEAPGVDPLREPFIVSSHQQHHQLYYDKHDPLACHPERVLYHQINESCTAFSSSSASFSGIRQRGQEQQQRRRKRRRRRRILDRDAAFHQSRGRWRVEHISRNAARRHIILPTGNRKRLAFTKRFWDDWFYALAYQRTLILMLILFLVYTAIVFAFAFVYLGASWLGQKSKINADGTISKLPFCDMDIHDHMQALYFSLSTMTTIGYGVSDYYFSGCWTPLILVLCQVFVAIAYNAVAIGLLFQRISRGHKRGKTIVFSNTAVIHRVDSSLYLMFRVGELRNHQLRDASVRAYCVRHERHASPAAAAATTIPSIAEQQQQEQEHSSDVLSELQSPSPQQQQQQSKQPQQQLTTSIETTHYVTRSLKLLHEQVCADVLMSLPQVIVHRLDSSSPLYPPEYWYDAAGQIHTRRTDPCNDDDDSASRDRMFDAEQIDIYDFLCDREAELVILMEGTDELTGAVIQARHSYTLEDLEWNRTFVPCVVPFRNDDDEENDGDNNDDDEGDDHWRIPCCGHGRTKPICVVDFAAFHDTVSAKENIDSSPYVY